MNNYKRIFCLSCKMRFDNDNEFDLHPCHIVFKMVDGKLTPEVSEILKLKRTRWGRFRDRILSWDISLGLAITGLILINTVVLIHFNFTITEGVIDGLGLGLALPRLLK